MMYVEIRGKNSLYRDKHIPFILGHTSFCSKNEKATKLFPYIL